MSIISAKDLKFIYNSSEKNSTIALKGVNIDIKQGEFVAILGHNGSGKSTLARHMNAILIPSEGSMLVDDMNTIDENLLYDIRKTVSMVFQNPDNQIVATVVEEDVAFALENLGIEPENIRKRVDDALRAVGMYEFRTHAPHLLSGGQKQRIAIAGVIALKPACVVMDEPTAMLDPRGRREVMEVISLLTHEFGITVILITHHMDEAAQADKIIVMNDGNVILEGKPSEIFENVDMLHAVGLALPQTIELLQDLKGKGADIDTNGLSVSACADIIAKYLED